MLFSLVSDEIPKCKAGTDLMKTRRMEKSFDFLLSNISVTVGIKQTKAKLQKYIFDKKWITWIT